jgi:hypothetical protein
VLISLGRNKIEWLHQTLPPCEEDEIPFLLKNQVLREVPNYADFDPLDYLVLDFSQAERKLLALTIPLVLRQSVVRAFRSIGRTPQRIGFRAVDAAELILRNNLNSKESEPCLVVNVAGNEVDLILTVGKKLTSIRSILLPEKTNIINAGRNLIGEIERTVTIGIDGVSDPIKKIFLFGDENEESELVNELMKKELEVNVINPFTLPKISAAEIPELPGRFASLLGNFLAHTAIPKPKPAWGIDFLHPKEAPKPKSYVRAASLAALLLVACVAGLYHWNQGVVQGLERELVQVKAEHQKVAGELQQIQPSWNVLRQTQFWEMQNILWLDELKELSVVLPNDQDLVVSQMSFTTGQTGNNPRVAGTIQLSGMVRDPAVLLKLQSDLHSKGRYMMQYPAPSPNPAGGGYPWLFRTAIYRLRNY